MKSGLNASWFLIVGTALALLAGAWGCQSKQAPQTPEGESEGRSAAAVKQQREVAEAARKDLFGKLSGRLMEVMAKEGPVAAIHVCSEEALQLTEQVGKKHGVGIGRTSFRLRNKKNSPPSWATNLIQQRADEPQFVNLPNGQLGALLPIHLQPQCLLCHGPKENIPDEVQQALAQQYPDDQATGFEVDQLRGWFWIEVPPVETAASDSPSEQETSPAA